jgi:hypothetical protein
MITMLNNPNSQPRETKSPPGRGRGGLLNVLFPSPFLYDFINELYIVKGYRNPLEY